MTAKNENHESGWIANSASPMMDRGFILLRFMLIIATSCVLLVEIGPDSFPPALLVLMGVALLSNLAFFVLPAERLRSSLVIGATIICDTMWITAALIATGKFSADFFYLYFFVLFLAGVGQNIRLITLSVVIICASYVILIGRTVGFDQALTSKALIRVPFLFTVAVFYGYLVNRLRGEHHRVTKEREIINRLERSRRVLEEANTTLQAEVEKRERIEKELRKFSRAAEQSSNLVMIIDDDEKVDFVNQLFEEISGIPSENVVGRGLEIFTKLGVPGEVLDQMVSSIRNRSEWRGELPLRQEDNSELWLSVSTSPIRSSEEEIINTVVIATDITDRVKIERRLTVANVELHRLGEVKSNFVSTVSHELKSPLTAIKNAVSLIDPNAESTANEKFLRMIKRSADRLNFIISDLLDMQKVESGKLTIVPAAVHLGSFLGEVVEPFESQAESASVELFLDASDTLPEVLADAKRIEQVVTNLISNALKATPKGGKIFVSAERSDDAVTVSVRDTGIGLSPEDQKDVFDAFFQAGNVLADRPSGTGLGLTICRDLVRGHGSNLHLESELGVGSRFSFSLPVVSERAAEIIAFENETRTKFRRHPYFTVLVIDFDADRPVGNEELSKYVFETLHKVLHHLVPRSLDVFCDQPAQGRAIVVLLSTPREGGWVVKRRLAATLATNLFEVGGRGMASLKVLGPAAYPEDGDYGAGLIDRAILVGENTEDES